jgi:hypothetical protein
MILEWVLLKKELQYCVLKVKFLKYARTGQSVPGEG